MKPAYRLTRDFFQILNLKCNKVKTLLKIPESTENVYRAY